jgi:NADH-quinone oxidoreductase subunit L
MVGGFIGLPAVIQGGDWNWIHHYLGAKYGGPVAETSLETHVPLALEWGLIGLSSVIALGVVYYAWSVYAAKGLAYDDLLADRFGGMYESWGAAYHWDDFYENVVVETVIEGIGRKAFAAFDTRVVDGAVNGIARLSQGASQVLRRTQTGVVQNYALALVLGVVLVVGILLVGV